MIPYLRLYDSSIFNYIKYNVLAPHFTETVSNQGLNYRASDGSYVIEPLSFPPDPTGKGRGLAVFDEATVNGEKVVDMTTEQSSQVVVAGPSSYNIDYLNGRILDADSPPTSVTYSWYYVSLIQGWPGESPPELPVVALDIFESDISGYQLGGGARDYIQGDIHVFATSDSEKKDIVDVIHTSLFNKTLQVGNWHEGSYVGYDGRYTGFNPTPVEGLSRGSFIDVKASLSGPRMDWSELNRHRSRISFGFEVFKG